MEGGREKGAVKNLANAAWSRWWRLVSSVMSHVESMSPWYNVMRMHFTSVVFLPKTHNPCLTPRKTSDKDNMRDILLNTCLGLLKTAKVLRNKESQKLSQIRGGLGDMITKCDGISWTGTQNRAQELRKAGKIWITSGVLLIMCANVESSFVTNVL